VAVMDSTNVVGHVPRKISQICFIFLLHSRSITCRVTQYSQDLEQGGLDVPCEYKFFSKDKHAKVTQRLLQVASFSTTDIVAGVEAAGVEASKDTVESNARLKESSTSCATISLATVSTHSSAASLSTTGSTSSLSYITTSSQLLTLLLLMVQ